MAGTFVGREAELDAIARSARPCVFVQGAGGIGKSALLRQLVGAARSRGERTLSIDGRDAVAAQAAIETLDGVDLLVVDSYEEAPALGPLLRALVGVGTVRVMIGSRRPPEPAWSDLDVLELLLGPLGAADARALATARGVASDQVDDLVAWSEGHPLSLAVAADASVAGRAIDGASLDRDEQLAAIIRRRIARDELEGGDHRVVALAAIARAVDARILAAVIDGLDGDGAEVWLRSLSFSEPLGTRVTLHARMRSAVATALAAENSEEDRALRLRLTDHLYGRIAAGERHLWGDLVELITDPAIRWGLAPVRMTHRVSRLRPGDEERIGELLGAADQQWWRDVQRWMRQAPDHVMVTIDEHDEISSWGIFMTPASAPAWAAEDPVTGPWLAHARRVQPDGDALLIRDNGELPVPEQTPAVSAAVVAGNYGVTLGAGLPTVRRIYGRSYAWDHAAIAFLLATGYTRAPEFDADDPDRQLLCFTNDFGPGGMFRAVRDLIYQGLGATPPVKTATAAGGSARDALRSFHDPVALAASPLATGATVQERAESVRALVWEATSAAFGDTTDERLLRETLELGYLDPEAGHPAAIQRLHVSRATYFRRLAEASERVAAYLER